MSSARISSLHDCSIVNVLCFFLTMHNTFCGVCCVEIAFISSVVASVTVWFLHKRALFDIQWGNAMISIICALLSISSVTMRSPSAMNVPAWSRPFLEWRMRMFFILFLESINIRS